MLTNRKPIDYTSQLNGLPNNTSHFNKDKLTHTNISDPLPPNIASSKVGSSTARISTSNGLGNKSNIGTMSARPSTVYSRSNPSSKKEDELNNRMNNLKERVEVAKNNDILKSTKAIDSSRPSTVASKLNISEKLNYKTKDSLSNNTTQSLSLPIHLINPYNSARNDLLLSGEIDKISVYNSENILDDLNNDGLINSVLDEIKKKDEVAINKEISKYETMNNNISTTIIHSKGSTTVENKRSEWTPKIPFRPGNSKIKLLSDMQFDSPKSEAIVCIDLFKDYIQECEKEMNHFGSRWLFLKFKFAELNSLTSNLPTPNMFNLLCTSYLLEYGVKLLISNSNSLNGTEGVVPGLDGGLLFDMVQSIFNSTFDTKSALLHGDPKGDMYFIKKSEPFFIRQRMVAGEIDSLQKEIKKGRTQFKTICSMFSKVQDDKSHAYLRIVFQSWKRFVKDRKLLVQVSYFFVKDTSRKQIDTAKKYFLFWKEWVKRKLLKRHLLQHEEDVREENVKLNQALSLTEQQFVQSAQRVQELNSELTVIKNNWVDPKTLPTSSEVTPKLLILLYSKLTTEVQNVCSMSSPQIYLLSPIQSNFDLHIKNINEMRNELGRLAELGAWETRNEVIKNISNTRAHIHDEEEKCLNDLLKEQVDNSITRWTNLQLAKTSCDRILHDPQTDLMDSEIFSYLISVIAPEQTLRKIEKVTDMRARAEEIFRHLEVMGCSPVIDVNEFSMGAKPLGYIITLCMMFISKPSIENSIKWSAEINERLNDFKKKLEVMFARSVIPSPDLAILMAEIEAISNDVQYQIQCNLDRQRHLNLLKEKYQLFIWRNMKRLTNISNAQGPTVTSIKGNNNNRRGSVAGNILPSMGLTQLDMVLKNETSYDSSQRSLLIALFTSCNTDLTTIFKQYSSMNLSSCQERISWSSWLKFYNDIKVAKIPFSSIYQIVFQAISNDKAINMTEIDLDFEEFLQSLIGLACHLNNSPTRPVEKMSKFIEENLLPLLYEPFNLSNYQRELYSTLVRTFFQSNILTIKPIFTQICTLKEPVPLMSYENFLWFSDKLKNPILNEKALVSIYDKVKIVNSLNLLTYSEFLELIVVCTLFIFPDPFSPLEKKLAQFLEQIVDRIQIV